MKRKLLLGMVICSAILPGARPAFGWGEKGHNVVVHIAQKHLSSKAKREVKKLLGGHDMAYWASWADGLRDDRRYDSFSTWHYANADEGYTYATSSKNPKGDVYTALNLCVEQLQVRGMNDSLRAMYLKLLIHFVGDMHCPMHAGRLSDRGGNNYAVNFRGRVTNLHSVWDSQLIDAAHVWSAQEWAMNIDYKMSRRERKELAAGTPLDWMEQTVTLAHLLYAETPQDISLSWGYINHWSPVAGRQLLESGYRLARILNGIFGCGGRKFSLSDAEMTSFGTNS